MNIKTLLLGLDNSGKTSIVLSLQKDVNLLSFIGIKPTKGISRVKFENFNTDGDYYLWDFGGQKQYRKEYIDDFKGLSSKASKIIYVFDVQDTERYNLAVQYLQDIIDKIQEENLKFEFSMFFHKYDPNLSEDIKELLEKELIPKVKKIVPEDWNCSYSKTCIFTVFNKTEVNI